MLAGWLRKLRYVRERGVGTLIREQGLGRLISTFADELSPARNLHTMISAAESRWAEKHIREQYSGKGEIVDLGCWLGSSTIALAKGLEANRRVIAGKHKVHAYDEFIWRDWMNLTFAGAALGDRFLPGDSFLDLFYAQTEKWTNDIEVHAGDLVEIDWIGRPIEFLFVDVMKNWKLTHAVLRKFFPFLVPGVSVVQHQDYAHCYTPEVALVMHRLRDYFEPVCFIRHSGSMVFRNTKHIPSELLKPEYSYADFSEQECDAAFAAAQKLAGRRAQRELDLARILAIAFRGDFEPAQAELERFKSSHGDSIPAIKNVQIRINECREAARVS